jgi:hypothetical protein
VASLSSEFEIRKICGGDYQTECKGGAFLSYLSGYATVRKQLSTGKPQPEKGV